jgi:hypothetical protein
MGRHRLSRFRARPGIRRYWDRAAGSARAYALLSTITLLEGVALVAGGTMRATAPSWRFVFALGGPAWFGAALAAVGLLMLAAPALSVTLLRAGLMLAAIAHLSLAFAFTGAALVDPRASFLAPVLFAGIGLHQLSHRESYRGVT